MEMWSQGFTGNPSPTYLHKGWPEQRYFKFRWYFAEILYLCSQNRKYRLSNVIT